MVERKTVMSVGYIQSYESYVVVVELGVTLRDKRKLRGRKLF